jgi:hypothetical protein
MGDRAVVVFVTDDEISPGVYLHWHGSDALDFLRAASPRLRRSDPGYSAARFCGFCHTQIEGNLSLGLIDAPTTEDFKDSFETYSPGNSGVFIVNCNSFKVTHYNYGEVDDYQLPEFPR